MYLLLACPTFFRIVSAYQQILYDILCKTYTESWILDLVRCSFYFTLFPHQDTILVLPIVVDEITLVVSSQCYSYLAIIGII